MLYKCLKCEKLLKGLGVPPHLSYKHAARTSNCTAKERLPRVHDYFLNDELVIVCLGEGFKEPEFADAKAVARVVENAKEHWRSEGVLK